MTALERPPIRTPPTIAERAFIQDEKLTRRRELAVGLKASQQHANKPLTVGAVLWTEDNVADLSGVRVAGGTVIAADPVVTRDGPAAALTGGVPAKVLRQS